METRQTELVTDDGRWKVALVDLSDTVLKRTEWFVYDLKPADPTSWWPVWSLIEDGDPYEEHEPGELDANDVLARFMALRKGEA